MNLIPKMSGFDLAWSAIPIAFLIYVVLQIDARRKDGASAGDDQLGIKTVAATLAVVSTLLLAIGLQGFLQAILTFDDFGARLEASLPSLVVGALGVVAMALVVFPRTNASEYPKAKRLAAGVVALVSGIALLPALAGFLSQLLAWPSWKVVATALATAVDAAVIFVISFAVLGTLSGLKMPEAKSTPMGPPPGQAGGMPPGGTQGPGGAMPPGGQVPGGMQGPGQGYPGQAMPQGYPPSGGTQVPQGQAGAGHPGAPGGGQGPGQGWPQQ